MSFLRKEELVTMDYAKSQTSLTSLIQEDLYDTTFDFSLRQHIAVQKAALAQWSDWSNIVQIIEVSFFGIFQL